MSIFPKSTMLLSIGQTHAKRKKERKDNFEITRKNFADEHSLLSFLRAMLHSPFPLINCSSAFRALLFSLVKALFRRWTLRSHVAERLYYSLVPYISTYNRSPFTNTTLSVTTQAVLKVYPQDFTRSPKWQCPLLGATTVIWFGASHFSQ